MATQSLQARYGKITHSTTRSSPPAPRPPGARGIQQIPSFADFYDMGKEVMPSTHRYMKVNFATRKTDKQEVVVKVRFKPACFRSRQDEKNWRLNTEFLLNLPDSIGVARVYEVMEDPTAFYVVMEKVGGLDLFETLEHMRKIPELIEVTSKAGSPELTKEWIRDQILVPKSMGSGYGCYARSASRGHSQGPPRPARPSSARMAVLASPRRSSSVTQSLGSGSISECLPSTASYSESDRYRPRSRGLRLRWPLEEREQAWGSLAPPVYSQASRRLRPASAKVHKHKRTPAEAWENEEDIYDDLEPSLAGDLEHCAELEDPWNARGLFECLEATTPRGGWIQEGMM